MASRGAIAARHADVRERLQRAMGRASERFGVPLPAPIAVPYRQPELRAAAELERVASFMEALVGSAPDAHPSLPDAPTGDGAGEAAPEAPAPENAPETGGDAPDAPPEQESEPEPADDAKPTDGDHPDQPHGRRRGRPRKQRH